MQTFNKFLTIKKLKDSNHPRFWHGGGDRVFIQLLIESADTDF